jgi:hypothetical protein
MRRRWFIACAGLLAMGVACTPAQAPRPLMDSGEVLVNGQPVHYVIRHLPPSSFPALPPAIAAQLTERGCLIPQTYQARQPENVVHASLEQAGSQDWAVLCSAQGTVSLLVFFASAPGAPTVLASAPETERLQPRVVSSDLGFNWGIDPASPSHVHEAQIGLQHRPPAPDHDALADSVIDRRTIYHFFTHGQWTLLDMPAQ